MRQVCDRGAADAGRACSRTPRSALTKRRCVAAAGTWRFSASTAPWLPRDRLSCARRKGRGQPRPLLRRSAACPAPAQPRRASVQRRRTTIVTVWPSESSRSVACEPMKPAPPCERRCKGSAACVSDTGLARDAYRAAALRAPRGARTVTSTCIFPGCQATRRIQSGTTTRAENARQSAVLAASVRRGVARDTLPARVLRWARGGARCGAALARRARRSAAAAASQQGPARRRRGTC